MIDPEGLSRHFARTIPAVHGRKDLGYQCRNACGCVRVDGLDEPDVSQVLDITSPRS